MAQRGKPFPTYVDESGEVVLSATDKFVMVEGGQTVHLEYSDLQAALNAQFAPLAPISISAGVFDISTGSPALNPAPANRQRAWLFDASSNERVQCMTHIPADWATCNVTIIWANAGAGAGNVVWRFFFDDVAEGYDMGAFWAGSATVTDAAGAQNATQIAVMSGVSIPTGLVTIAVDRNAADGGDTLANDCAMYGILIERES